MEWNNSTLWMIYKFRVSLIEKCVLNIVNAGEEKKTKEQQEEEEKKRKSL